MRLEMVMQINEFVGKLCQTETQTVKLWCYRFESRQVVLSLWRHSPSRYHRRRWNLKRFIPILCHLYLDYISNHTYLRPLAHKPRLTPIGMRL